MDKYINESMKQVCEDLEDQQSWEDEQFMRELDEALGFNESKDGWRNWCVPDDTLLERED